MKKLALILALTTAIPANAGGPIVLEDPEVIAPRDTAEWVLPVVIGAVILCALACGGSDDAPVVQPPKEPGPVCYSEGC